MVIWNLVSGCRNLYIRLQPHTATTSCRESQACTRLRKEGSNELYHLLPRFVGITACPRFSGIFWLSVWPLDRTRLPDTKCPRSKLLMTSVWKKTQHSNSIKFIYCNDPPDHQESTIITPTMIEESNNQQFITHNSPMRWLRWLCYLLPFVAWWLHRTLDGLGTAPPAVWVAILSRADATARRKQIRQMWQAMTCGSAKFVLCQQGRGNSFELWLIPYQWDTWFCWITGVGSMSRWIPGGWSTSINIKCHFSCSPCQAPNLQLLSSYCWMSWEGTF